MVIHLPHALQKLHVHLIPAAPISNAICSYWSGLDEELSLENMKKIMGEVSEDTVSIQNADTGKNDTSWEEYIRSIHKWS